MSWKSVVVLVATLAFDASLMAQDKQSAPFLGIWELNLDKTTNYPQQGQTMINVPAPRGGFISTRATIGNENKSSSTEIHPVVFDGKPHQTTGGDAREISLQTDRSVHDRRTQNRNGRIPVDTEQVSGSKLFQKRKHSSIIG
jgi:hypothetical protein